MKNRKKLIGLTALALLALFTCAVAVIQRMVPPGEEWVAYGNEELIAAIDRQIQGFDMEKTVAEKEKYLYEKSVEEIQQAVGRGDLTYKEITAICLYRIKTVDQNRHGLNSVVAVAPDAVRQAVRKDEELAGRRLSGETGGLPPLFGIPVMVKDNINTYDMPTSAGAVAFSDFIPVEDASVVDALRKEGAIILGKNNLSEFAYFVSSVMPSGYSGVKGQTVNPFGPIKISPSGSSSGSAVSVAANLVPVSIGTETAGSIVGPAAANSVVGFKPSRGWVPGDGIFPLIRKVDTPGPIAKTVRDVAIAYGAITGREIPLAAGDKYLDGKVIGFVEYDYMDGEMQQDLKDGLERAGARVVEAQLDHSGVQVQNIITLSFKQDFEAYAREYGLPVRTLAELIRFNQADRKRRARYGQDLLEESDAVGEPDMDAIEVSIQYARNVIDHAFEEQGLDAMVFLNAAGFGEASAAGYPELTIPFGANSKGVPQGATFITRYGEEEKLLNIGYAFEQNTDGRLVP